MNNVEQVFRTRFELLLSSGLASQESIAAALDTLRQVEQKAGIDLDEALGAPLATHLAITLHRLLQDELLQPAPEVLWQELQDYPAQVELASTLVAGLAERLGLQIPADEVGFIAIHLARIALEAENLPGRSGPSTPEER